MFTSATAASDYFSGRPLASSRTRPPTNVLHSSPRSPRTPLLARSGSSHLGSPASFRVEQEDIVVYELSARQLSVGFGGEVRPRVVYRFGQDVARRAGDYRAYETASTARAQQVVLRRRGWSEEYELYGHDIRSLDLGLVEDQLERAVRDIHAHHLQLDQKPRRAVMVTPSLFPTPLLQIAMKVVFNHFTQPPSLVILTSPTMNCVGAGLRNALVVDVGWEETVVVAVGEYKEICQRRSVRAGEMLTREVAKVLDEEMRLDINIAKLKVEFKLADEVVQRMAWCRAKDEGGSSQAAENSVSLPVYGETGREHLRLPFHRLANPAEAVFFASPSHESQDDHDLPVHELAYSVLLALPLELRAMCLSRIVMSGDASRIPGLRHRLLQELSHLVETRSWDPVQNYGSAAKLHQRTLKERSTNVATRLKPPDLGELQYSLTKMPVQDHIPHGHRVHDDVKDIITLKAERATRGGDAERTKAKTMAVRGVETLGAWAGASLVASLRVKGVHEAEREDFLKHGLRDANVF